MATRTPWTLVALLTVAAAAGCASASDAGQASNPGPAPVASSTASSTPAGVPDLGAPKELARGIDVPWGLTFLPGGDALIAERETARILRLTPGSGQARQVYQVPGAAPMREGGLLGLAASPRFAQDNPVYAYFTAEQDNRIVRFRLDSDEPPEVILDGIAEATYHNGGRIAFGPDGMLYAGVGDAGDTRSAQDPASLNGKILRLTPDGEPAPGNPTAGSPVYSLGHRNVQGLAWDGQGRMFAAEFGQNELYEVNSIEPGHNYGWPVVEGTGDTAGGRYANPLVTWPVSEASPSGLAIAGDTIYVAALRGQRLWTIPITGDTLGEPSAQLQERYGRLRTVQVAPGRRTVADHLQHRRAHRPARGRRPHPALPRTLTGPAA